MDNSYDLKEKCLMIIEISGYYRITKKQLQGFIYNCIVVEGCSPFSSFECDENLGVF